MTQSKKERRDKEWEKRFDKEFPRWPEPQKGAGREIGPLFGAGMYEQYESDRDYRDKETNKIKSFIRQLLARQKEEAYEKGYASGFMNGAEKGFSKVKPKLKGEL